MENIYYYKRISNTFSYQEDILLPLEKLTILKNGLWEDSSHFTYFSVPTNICKLLIDLLEKNSLQTYTSDFISVFAYIQKKYFEEQVHLSKEKSIDEDFINLQRDLAQLFDIVEKYLFSNDYNYLKSIYFKNKTNDNLVVENFFVIQDIYSSIIEYHGFTKDNFHSKKIELLSTNNTSAFIDTSELYKKQVIKQLFSFLQEHDFKKSDSLRFIGVFLHLAQIQSNNNQPLEIYNSISENEHQIDVKNLTHYINRK